MNSIPTTSQRVTRVLQNRQLSETGFELTMERNGLPFRAGELVSVQGRNRLDARDYTLCSGVEDDFLSIVFRLIPGGCLSPQLAALRAGDPVTLSGPYGTFTLREPGRPLLFLATGTGIAPARSYLRSHPGLQMTLVHGVARAQDLFYREEFSAIRYQACVSRESGYEFPRVTDWLAQHDVPEDHHIYLCGANEMIYACKEILERRNFPHGQVFHEPYYYRWDT